MLRASGFRVHHGLPQSEFLDLAAWRARQVGQDFQPFGDVLDGDLLLFQEGDHLIEGQRCVLAQTDEGAGAFAEARIGIADNGGGLDGGMLEQQALDLDYGDVLTAANDDVLGAPDDADISVGIHPGDVAGFQTSRPAKYWLDLAA